ncbi:winged helix-turn-helix transcriptional regulator, partial [Pseudomonas simiae]
MDRIDKKILAQLQQDGRQSLTELADRVGLSLSPCHRRVRAMEDAGVIKG